MAERASEGREPATRRHAVGRGRSIRFALAPRTGLGLSGGRVVGGPSATAISHQVSSIEYHQGRRRNAATAGGWGRGLHYSTTYYM